MKIALMITAKSRPYYLKDTLTSWALADDVNTLDHLVIALGRSDKEMEQRELIKKLAPGARIWLDSDRAAASNGMHRVIAEAVSRIFAALKPDLVICGEEDVIPSSDIIRYFKWAAEKFQNDKRVLCICAHSRSGTGWDKYEPADDADADQEKVRLLEYFNPWIWGVWRDRWENIMEKEWDYECDSGGPTDSGYDWNLATRILPRHKMLAVVPDAARSQTIGRHEGWASNEWSWSFSQAQSFRERRESDLQYRLVGYRDKEDVETGFYWGTRCPNEVTN